MDPTQMKYMKSGGSADESKQAGYFLAGGIVLAIGGVLMILQVGSVADFGGGMLVLIGLALVAASFWISSQSRT